MNIVEFIEHVLIREFKDITDRHKYLSFGVISQGIELLGSCLDKHDFDCDGKAGERVDLVLNELFPDEYKDFANRKDLKKSIYKNIRCGFLHYGLPKGTFAVGELINLKRELHLKESKLKDGSERYVLIAEVFYEDFRDACTKLIKMIENGSIMEREEIKECKSVKKKNILSLKQDFLWIG
ncbi:hypothetical protein KA005_58225 [bacterium]|nr:hypothetical protein [bacterium]